MYRYAIRQISHRSEVLSLKKFNLVSSLLSRSQKGEPETSRALIFTTYSEQKSPIIWALLKKIRAEKTESLVLASEPSLKNRISTYVFRL